MARLNQIIAIEKGIKSRSVQELAEAQKALQKPAVLSGISRTYRPKDEEGEQLPPESKKVEVKAEEIIRKTTEVLTKLFDVTATKDWTNCSARADVIVDGNVLLSQVPVSYLLFIEKQLVDLQAFIKKLPVLDASETWNFDASADCWATEPVQTLKTFKTPRNHVKAEATEHHPAQVDVYYEDITIGYWRTVKFSGALLRGGSMSCCKGWKSCSRLLCSPAKKLTILKLRTKEWESEFFNLFSADCLLF
jgi:hypothetical protein